MHAPDLGGATAPPARSTSSDGLVWGLKRSWTDYIDRLDDGSVSVDGGARMLTTGEFFFPVCTVRPGAVAFSGAVRFDGHYGMLSLRIEDISITRHPSGLMLRASTSDGDDVPLVELDLDLADADADAEVEGLAFTSTLTMEGSDLFLFRYPSGTPFDQVRISASLGETLRGAMQASAVHDG